MRVFQGAIQAVPTTDDTNNGALEAQTNKALCELGRALAFALPVHKPSARELRFHLLEESFCQNVLRRVAHRYSCQCANRQCIVCLFRWLSRLPPELLLAHILPRVAHSYVRQTVPIYGEILEVFSLLENHPAGDYSISCADTVTGTRLFFGRGSYISGLFDQQIPGAGVTPRHGAQTETIRCSPLLRDIIDLRRETAETIKSLNDKPKHIVVWTDKIGVTDIKFLNSKAIDDLDQIKHKWVYTFPFANHIRVLVKVWKHRLEGIRSF